jgi:hypothetical protein
MDPEVIARLLARNAEDKPLGRLRASLRCLIGGQTGAVPSAGQIAWASSVNNAASRSGAEPRWKSSGAYILLDSGERIGTRTNLGPRCCS